MSSLLRHTRYALVLLCTMSCFSCSTTKNLPEGQVLYTGQRSVTITNNPETPAGELALEEVEVALAKAPNNSLLGSSTMRIPFPFGLWIYNAFVHSEKGLGKWIFKRMAAKPVFISDVNPELRQKAATNILRDYGFFQGAVTHDILPDKRDSLKAKIQFHVDLNRPYLLDSVEYRGFTPEMMRIIERGGTRTALRRGVQFSVIDLDEERQRLSTIFRNVGYYYFRPEFFAFRADTTQVSGEVDLRIVPQSGIPANALKNWNIGQVTFNLIGKDGEQPDHTVQYQDMTLRYHRSLAIRPEILYRQLRVRTGQRYSQRLVELTQQKLAELGVFSYTDMQFAPNDSVSESNLLNVNVTSGFDFPYDSRLEFNVTSKSNDYAGPGATFSISRKNLFRGGETFTVTATGSYEWQTKSPVSSNTKFNSWEFGLDAGLSYPFVVFPGWRMKDYDFTATTAFALNVNQLNRARFFKMLSFGGSMTYGIQRTRVSRHTITPFSLTFSTLQSRTAEFDEIMATNPALQKSMENQFIPALSYTYTYDDASARRRQDRNHLWWQASVTSSGLLTSGVYALFGKGFGAEKQLLGADLAQYVKLIGEFRYTWGIDRNQSIATRFLAGTLLAYGGTRYAPYREQFYIGGANSLRAFTVRSIGPGAYPPARNNRYAYLDQTGDMKLEANLEYRFRLIGDLHGAVFLDAGNVWLLREREGIRSGRFSWKNFLNEAALGSGAGIRYDMDILVLRLDCGVALHLPYNTGKSGYFNVHKYSDYLGIHFAVGYPF